MYTQTFGFLGSQWARGWMNRPDWRNAIISNANQRMYRNAEKVYHASGRLAVACYDDALYYVSDSPDPRDVSPFFTEKSLIDAYKYKDSYLIESDLARELFDQTPQVFSRDIKLYSLTESERTKAQESAREQSAGDSARAARLAESVRLFDAPFGEGIPGDMDDEEIEPFEANWRRKREMEAAHGETVGQ